MKNSCRPDCPLVCERTCAAAEGESFTSVPAPCNPAAVCGIGIVTTTVPLDKIRDLLHPLRTLPLVCPAPEDAGQTRKRMRCPAFYRGGRFLARRICVPIGVIIAVARGVILIILSAGAAFAVLCLLLEHVL